MNGNKLVVWLIGMVIAGVIGWIGLVQHDVSIVGKLARETSDEQQRRRTVVLEDMPALKQRLATVELSFAKVGAVEARLQALENISARLEMKIDRLVERLMQQPRMLEKYPREFP